MQAKQSLSQPGESSGILSSIGLQAPASFSHRMWSPQEGCDFAGGGSSAPEASPQEADSCRLPAACTSHSWAAQASLTEEPGSRFQYLSRRFNFTFGII